MEDAFREGFRAAQLLAVRKIEARRQKILANPDDPSWTEHLAELGGEVAAMSADEAVVRSVLDD